MSDTVFEFYFPWFGNFFSLSVSVSLSLALSHMKPEVGRSMPVRSLIPGGGGNSLYFVWYRRAAGIAPIFQVIYTSTGHDFISDIHL